MNYFCVRLNKVISQDEFRDCHDCGIAEAFAQKNTVFSSICKTSQTVGDARSTEYKSNMNKLIREHKLKRIVQ